ncbi:unnamed protein product [Rotaria sp. Silwood2]|nr:unnamed protein product [Rotaria sp. Silwood2]
MTQASNRIISNKSSFVSGTKTSPPMSVIFQLDETNELPTMTNIKQPSRKKPLEPLIIHEIQSWSSFVGKSAVKHVLADINESPTSSCQSKISRNQRLQQMNTNQTFLPNKERKNRCRSALIDRKKQYYHRHDELTWRSLFGTMPDINQILTNKRFLYGRPWLQSLIIFIDSCFRGVGQVMFANNPISGFMITVGLLIGQWQLALYGLLGTITSTLTAYIIGLDYGSIRAGLYGYNGCLTAIILAYFSCAFYSPLIIGPILLMSACSTIFLVAIAKLVAVRLGLSPFTFSSQMCSLLWLLGAMKFRYFSVDETLLTSGLLRTFIEKPSLSNITITQYSLIDIFAGFPASVSQVYFINSPLTGIIILLGILICSPILSFFALFGSIIGQLSAAYLFGLPAETIRMGLGGYNSVLTCQALGGMFFVLSGYQIWFFTLFGSIMSVIAQIAISVFFSPIGIPPLLLPSTLISWIFCLMAESSKNMIAVKLSAVSIPEDHLRRFHLTSLVKAHFEFLNNLSTILQKSRHDEDISIEDLTIIEAEFVPILLCSYAYQNDIKNLKALLHEGADVNSTDYDLRSPLHLAACGGKSELCVMLVRNFRANVNLVDELGGTPLYDAFCHGNFHLIPFLYAWGARMPGSKTTELAFCLCAFSFEGNLEAVQYLVACGVNPNLADYNGRTALHLAVCGNHFSIVKYLVEEGKASLSIADYYNQTPIQYALHLTDNRIADYFHHCRDQTSKQKPRKINIFMEDTFIDDDDDHDHDHDDDDGNQEQENNDEESSENISMTVEESLLPALFCMAAAEGDIKQMANLLEQFPEFRADSVDYDFRSAAHVAAAEGQLSSIEFLCEYSYRKNQDLSWIKREDRWGFSPIEEAYHYGHYEVANYLIERIKNNQNLILSNPKQNFKIKPIVISMRQWKKVLHFGALASNNEAELIDGLISTGVFLSSELYADYDGRTPMHLAAANGHLDVIKVLQRYGYDGKTQRDRWGNSALDEARRKKFTEIIDILLEDIV